MTLLQPRNLSSHYPSAACDDDNCACAECPDAYHPLYTGRAWLAHDLMAHEIRLVTQLKADELWEKMKTWSIQSTYAELYGEF